MVISRIAIVLGVLGLMAPALAAAQTDKTTREERMDAALKDYQSGKPAMTAPMPPSPQSTKTQKHPKSH